MSEFFTTLNQTAVFGDTTEGPGTFPFTRGLHKQGYRARHWTIRQYAGFGGPSETNQRFRFLLSQGQTGLSLAFDLPTQMGLDPDDARSRGEVGRVGVSLSSVDDMIAIVSGLPLDQLSLSMTINATAPILVAFLQVAAEEQGFDASKLMGTVQNDVLKEFVARGTYVFPPKPSLRLATDLIAHCSRTLPKFNAISVSGYHMRDAGCSIEQEMGLALAHAIAYCERLISMGLSIDQFAGQISWIFNTQNEFFAEIAKYRALRRMWARIVKEKFGAKDPKSMQLRVHVQTGGATLTAQQPENNIVRAAYQAMASVLGGVQSLALSCFDEAIAIPTERSQTLALRTQQILANETGITEVVDPLGGSPYIEALTDELERRASEVMQTIERTGGALKAIESGLTSQLIDDASYQYQQSLESKKRLIIGVNCFEETSSQAKPERFKLSLTSENQTIERLKKLKATRDSLKASAALDALHAKCTGAKDETLMPEILAAARARCTVGEITATLAKTFGRHRQG